MCWLLKPARLDSVIYTLYPGRSIHVIISQLATTGSSNASFQRVGAPRVAAPASNAPP